MTQSTPAEDFTDWLAGRLGARPASDDAPAESVALGNHVASEGTNPHTPSAGNSPGAALGDFISEQLQNGTYSNNNL